MKSIFKNLLFFCLFPSCIFAQGFVHRDGQNIVDGNGKSIVFRGLGLGGWMVQEGYMLNLGGGYQHTSAPRSSGTDIEGEVIRRVDDTKNSLDRP